jgi:hypothetical protein
MFKVKVFGLGFAALLLTSCAQMAPPVPPSLELPKPVADLKAVRKGDKVYLRWTPPAQTTDGESVGRLGATRICRSLDGSTRQCDKVGDVLASQLPKVSPANAKPPAAANEANYVDTLPADLQQDPKKILSYSVSVENESGRSAGLSNRVQIPAALTLPAPTDFKAQASADGVVLSWTAISPPPEFHGSYRIYRQQDGSSTSLVAGELPLDPSSTQFVDHGFEWGKTYYYHVTVVTEVAAEGMHGCGTPPKDCASVFLVEGDDSPTVKVFANDVFPPAVPSGLQAVYSGEGQKPFVDLLWAPDTEGDLAGYNVYRREAGGTASKLNPEPVKPSAYRDFAVEPGKQYFYSITAVDLRGNESGHSEEASEQVP